MLLCLIGFLATQSVAECPVGQEPFTSCQIDGRGTEVFVCFNDQIATYRYGQIEGPAELVLSELVKDVDFEPWSGLGTAISEEVTFYNRGYGYNVGGGFERPFSDEDMDGPIERFGWIDVIEDGTPLLRLECIADTVTYGFGGGIYDAKVAAGLTWDDLSRTWISADFMALAEPVLSKDEQHGDCMPASEFRMGSVTMGDTATALGKLGTLEATDDYGFSDEPVDQMLAFGATFYFFKDVVVRMIATSSTWNTPSGLKVGLTKGEVIRLLGRVPDGYPATADSFVIGQCGEAEQNAIGEWYAILEFGQNKRLDRMHFVTSSE